MNVRKTLRKIFGSKASRGRLPLTYGLFCVNTEFALAPAAVYYTRYAADRKCRELNTSSAKRWSIRPLA
jgi:hypothetical protein